MTGLSFDIAVAPGTPELGVYSRRNLTRFKNAINTAGGDLVWCRNYPQGANGATDVTAAQISAEIAPLAAQGYRNYTSFKSTFTWEQVASGSDDARWTSIGNMLNGITPAGAWCFYHEPENDRISYGSAANGAAFCAAFNRVASIIKPLAPDWYASPCLFDTIFPSYEFTRNANWAGTLNPNDWWPSSGDLFGFDYYAYRGASDGGSHWATMDNFTDYNAVIDDVMTYVDSWGVPMCFPEFGTTVRDPGQTGAAWSSATTYAVNAIVTNSGSTWYSKASSNLSHAPTSSPTWWGNLALDESVRRTWLQGVADKIRDDPRVLMIAYFEVNDQDEVKGNYAITDDDKPPTSPATVSAFASAQGTFASAAANTVVFG